MKGMSSIAEPQTQNKEYYRFLDGFRAIAILWVICHHLLPYYKTLAAAKFLQPLQMFISRLGEIGFLGVDIFFVTSGFLITGLLIDDLNDKIRVKRFYSRRILKIVPHYLLIVLVTLAFLPVIAPETNGLTLSSYFLMFQNYVPPVPTLAHLWSIAVEEHFYLLYPLILSAICAMTPNPPTRRKILIYSCAFIIPIENYVRYISFSHSAAHFDPPILFQKSHLRFDALALGCLIKALEPYFIQIRENAKSIIARGSFIAGISIFVFLFINYQLNHWEHYTAAYVASGLLIISGLLNYGPLVHMTENESLRNIGKNSYGIYLWHYVIIHADGLWKPLETSLFTLCPSLYLLPTSLLAFLSILAFTSLSIVFGTFTTQTVERYFLNMRKNLCP